MGQGHSAILLGSVLPLSNGLQTQQAVSFQGESIADVGRAESLKARLPDAKVYDFGNRTVMPGFIDSHIHASASATGASFMLDCVNTCCSIEEMQEVMTANLYRAKETGWINARGLFMANLRWKDGRYPTREDLDKVSTAVPIALRTGHVSILNTKALEVVEIEKHYGRVHGSGGAVAIQMGDDGKPNGRVSNLDGLLPYPEPSDDDIERALEDGIREYCTAMGLTTVCEITDSRRSLNILSRLIGEDKIKTRFKLFLRVPRQCSFAEALAWREDGLPDIAGRMEFAGIKLFADGGYSSADAATFGSYIDDLAPSEHGVLNFSDNELEDILRRSADKGIQMAFHANGERSQEQISRIYRSMGLAGHAPPVRLEHGANWVWEKQTPSYWDPQSIIPVPNPMFVALMAPAMPAFLGAYGAGKGRLPLRTLHDQGWELPAGSDATHYYDANVANPFYSIWCCLKRYGWDGVPIEPEEAIDLETAIKMHTLWPARLIGEDHLKGTLEANKLADVVVLDRNLLETTDEDIKNVKVDFVFRGGELVYARKGVAEAGFNA